MSDYSPNTTKADDVNSAAADLKDSATSAVHDAMDTASEQVRSRAEGARTAAADEVQGIAHALRKAADDLREGSPQERTFSQIAHGLADASEAMRDKDMGEMVGDLADFARRNPLVFLGGAALVGFAATRFAKATSDGGYPSSSISAADVTRTPARSSGTYSNTGFEAPRPAGTPPSGGSSVASPAVATSRTGENS